MLDINNWQQSDFLDRGNYETLKKQADDFLLYNMEREAFDLHNELFKRYDLIEGLSDSDLKDKYLKLLEILKFIALPRLNNRFVLEIVKKEIVEAFDFNQEDLNIKEKIKKKLINIPLVERDSYKKSLIGALEENEQVITKGELDMDSGKIDGTIGNWIKDYHKFAVDSKIDKKLIKAEYLYKNKNAIGLDEADRVKVKILLDLYETWQKSSFTVEGREDAMLINDNGKLYGVYDGEIFEMEGAGGAGSTTAPESVKRRLETSVLPEKPIGQEKIVSVREADKDEAVSGVLVEHKAEVEPSKTENSADILQKAFQQFLSGDLMNRVFEREEEIQKETGENLKALRNKFYHSINEKETENTVATLFALSENGQIRQAFGEDERFRKFWGNYLQKMINKSSAVDTTGLHAQHGADKGFQAQLEADKGAPRTAWSQQEFKNNPADSKYLAMFFKYILEQRLGLFEEDALMIGMVMANLSRKTGELEYQEMVYGDVEDGKFRWNI